MKDEDCPPPKFARLLRAAEAQMCRLAGENPYRLYDFLHRTAARLGAADAFYVALYSEPYQALFFAYNADGDVYDEPVTLPLGSGPTSQVVRTKKPYSLTRRNADVQDRGIQFGDSERVSHSALHVPIRPQDGDRDGPVLGVVSMHSYQRDAYTDETTAALQWLADKAGTLLARERDETAWRYRLSAAQTHYAEWQRPLVTMADEFVAMLVKITKEAERLRGTSAEQWPDAIQSLCQSCYAAQTSANQLPLRPGLAPPPAPQPAASPLDELTPREREVLELMAAGEADKEIAKSLKVGVNTVKYHVRNVYLKFGVASRTQAARIYLSAPPKS